MKEFRRGILNPGVRFCAYATEVLCEKFTILLPEYDWLFVMFEVFAGAFWLELFVKHQTFKKAFPARRCVPPVCTLSKNLSVQQTEIFLNSKHRALSKGSDTHRALRI